MRGGRRAVFYSGAGGSRLPLSRSVCKAPRLRSFSLVAPLGSSGVGLRLHGGARSLSRALWLSSGSLSVCCCAPPPVRSLFVAPLGSSGVGLGLHGGARSCLGALALVWLSVGLLCAAPPFVLSRRAAWEQRDGLRLMAARGLVSALWLSSGSLSVCCAPRLRSFSLVAPLGSGGWVKVAWRRAVLSRRSGSRLASVGLLCAAPPFVLSRRAAWEQRGGLRLRGGARSCLDAGSRVASVGLLCAAPPFVLSRRAAWEQRGGVKVAWRRAVLSRRSGSRLALCRSVVRRASVRSLSSRRLGARGGVKVAWRRRHPRRWLSLVVSSSLCARLRRSLSSRRLGGGGGLGLDGGARSGRRSLSLVSSAVVRRASVRLSRRAAWAPGVG